MKKILVMLAIAGVATLSGCSSFTNSINANYHSVWSPVGDEEITDATGVGGVNPTTGSSPTQIGKGMGRASGSRGTNAGSPAGGGAVAVANHGHGPNTAGCCGSSARGSSGSGSNGGHGGAGNH